MALIRAGQAVADSGGGAVASTDPVVANAATLTIGDWEDVEDVAPLAGQALLMMTQAGDALSFQPAWGSHYSGARLQDAIPAGDFLVAFDFAVARTANAVEAAGIWGVVGVAPGGLEAAQVDWVGCGIDARTAKSGSVNVQGHYREASGLWLGLNLGPVGGHGGYGHRFAIQRSGTTMTLWVVEPGQNNLLQLGQRTNAGYAGEADVFIRTQGGAGAGNSRYVTLTRMALTGLAISGNRLVAA